MPVLSPPSSRLSARETSGADSPSSHAIIGAALLLCVLIGLAYANSLSGPFVYDDKPSIPYNTSIRSLANFKEVLNPPGDGATVSGRPVLNLSLAVNYAVGGLDVRGYRATNILIHGFAALTLFGLVRRILTRPRQHAGCRQVGVYAGFFVAAAWALHPVQTESVSYVIQRAESLMGLFYLLTLYAFWRSTEGSKPRVWQIVSCLACALGMATKENMVSAPLAVLLLDRAFAAGTFAGAWRARRGYYAALMSTWLVLGLLVLTTGGNRGGTAGFDVGVGFWSYALTQFPAMVRYGALCVWPYPLVFDYGSFFISSVSSVAWEAVLVVGFVGATVYALVRQPKAGFLAASALAVLAPTSLVPGTTQMIVEHRMYLPLAAVMAALCPVVRFGARRSLFVAAALIVLALGVATAARNRVYRSEVRLWADTATKRPGNVVARSSLGAALGDLGRLEDAIREHRAALSIDPDHAPALSNLGLALTESGRPKEAIPLIGRAIATDPSNAQAHLNIGVTYDVLHRQEEALPHYVEAVRLNPLLPAAHNNLGDALCRSGKLEEGTAHLRRALELQPDYANAHLNLATALARGGQMDAARASFAKGASLLPGDAGPYVSWAAFLLQQGNVDEALLNYETALRVRSDAPEARYSYATALAGAGRYDEAIRQYLEAIRLKPDYAEAHNNLGNTYLAANRVGDAIAEYEAALALRPDDPNTHNNLGLALARSGRLREALDHFETAVRLAPHLASAQQNAARARAQLGL